MDGAWTSDDLTAVNAAIRTLMTGGQRIMVFHRQFERAQLSELRQLRNDIKAEIAATTRGGMRVRLGRPM